MKKIIILISILINSIYLFGQTNQLISNEANSKINVLGYGIVSTFPNAANITISIKFTKPTLKEAMTENQITTRKALEVIKKYVEDTTEIKVSFISTDKSMKWDNNLKKDVFIGFESNQNIIFTLKELSRIQDFMEEILKVKIYEISKISYFHTAAANFMKQAQEMALKDAIETTERLAKNANMKTTKILYIQTSKSPSEAINTTVNAYDFQTYGKMELAGRGVSSSGQLINYITTVTLTTAIE